MKNTSMKWDFNINLKKVSSLIGNEIPLPFYATEGSAGMDLAACIKEEIYIKPGERKIIPTGIAIDIPNNDIVGLIFPRSGISSKYGLSLANCTGVIDSDYKGEIKCPLENKGNKTFIVKPGDRIAQLLFLPVYKVKFNVVKEISHSSRGDGGFGHTGR